MKNRLSNIITVSARIIVISIALAAIMLSGSSFITVRSFEPDRTNQTESAKSVLSFDVKLPIGDHSVADSKPYGTGKTYYYSIPAVFSLNNLNETRPVTQIIELKPERNIGLHIYERLITAVLISSDKAQEFTLVGAKPSGTS